MGWRSADIYLSLLTESGDGDRGWLALADGMARVWSSN